MSDPVGPGEYIPPRRIEEGNNVLFHDIANGDGQERGRVVSVDHTTDQQLASIQIYSDERTETDVPFAYGDFQPDRGYVYDGEIIDGGTLGG